MLAANPTTYPTIITTAVKAKICGFTEPRRAIYAAQSGASMIGLVFAPSRRQVTVAAALNIVNPLKRAYGKHTQVVGVFVNETPQEMLRVAREVGLDLLQLSGDEPPNVVAECARHYPVLKALRFPQGTSPQNALEVIRLYRQAVDAPNLRFLIDAHHITEYGGTGTKADWSLAALLAQQEEIVLAGGLTPNNVSEAVHTVRPWAVDVSSGVESGGAKDPDLIKQFITGTLTPHV